VDAVRQASDATAAAALVADAAAAGAPALDEARAKTLLAAYGIAVPANVVVHDEGEAVAAAASLGRPVAMKALGAAIQHKSERGLVALDIRDPGAVRSTYRALVKRAGDDLEGVLVEAMVAGDRELMVGMKRDAAFGPVIAFGLGGVFTEALQDIALGLAPLDEEQAAELFGLIRAQRLLGAYRGLPPVDRDALAHVVTAVGRMAEDHPEIREIDLNPVLIVGGLPVAVDALIVLGAPGDGPAGAPPRSAPDLRPVCAPDSVAIVGASGDVSRWGGSALKNILDGGYEGRIYPVNPKGGTYFGLESYPDLDALPEAPDLALLAVGARQAAGVVEQCGRRGIPAAVAIAAGFSETGPEGKLAEAALAATAAAAGVTLIGPNCMGLVSNERKLHATGFIALHPSPGNLSLVSQSGNLGVQMVMAAERRGIGLEKFIGVGNEAQVTIVDVLEHLHDDPRTGGIILYVEGIEDGRRFVDVASRTTADKPVVVLRGGRTDAGGRAAASHTGAMAGSAAVFEAAARRAGVITCTASDEALDLACSLTNLPLPRGPRVAVVTNGGGAGVLATDEVAQTGLLELATLPPDLIAELDGILPPFWSRRNPLDLVASAGGDVAARVLSAVAACDAIDAVIVLSVLGVPNTGDDVRPATSTGEYEGLSHWETAFVELVAQLMEATGKPIINVPDIPITRALFPSGGRFSPVSLPTPRAAAKTLDRMVWYARHRQANDNAIPDAHDRKGGS
jgi:acyl-CoA synthetase (NDP forming)